VETTIIIPTYNEAENIPELVSRIRKAVDGVRILVMDDSPNPHTANAAWKAGCEVIQRTKDRGLSAAVIDGIRYTASNKIIVMDADLQHPPELLPRVIEELDRADFVITNRRCKEGSFGKWSFKRKAISLIANLLAKPLLPKVSDTTTGYFGLRYEVLPDNLDVLSPQGFKIMLELLVKGRVKSITEVPMQFGMRHTGVSKLKGKTIREYLLQLVSLYLYKFRWLRFGLVGTVGAMIGFPVLYTLTEFVGLFYLISAVVAIVCASTSNYFLNNHWTFREKRRTGLKGHLMGWFNYQCMSATGDGLYLGLLALFTEVVGLWYVLSAAISLIAVFALKFSLANTIIWRRKVGQVTPQ